MLLRQNPLRQRVRVVVLQNRNRPLQHDYPVIQILIHKMHGATSYLHAVSKRLLLRIQPREGGQK